MDWTLQSNPLDSQKTVDFSIKKKQFSSNHFKETPQNNNIIFIEKSKK